MWELYVKHWYRPGERERKADFWITPLHSSLDNRFFFLRRSFAVVTQT